MAGNHAAPGSRPTSPKNAIMTARLLPQGNCTDPPTATDVALLATKTGAAGLLTVQPTQCLILTHEDLFHSLSPGCDRGTLPGRPSSTLLCSLGQLRPLHT